MDYTENLKVFEELLQTSQLKAQTDPHKGQLEALQEMMQKNEEAIAAEFQHLLGWVRYRVSYLRELQEVNAHLSERIARIQNEGERPTVPTAIAHLQTTDN